MLRFALLCVTLTVATGATLPDPWAVFKAKYAKSYQSYEEDLLRKFVHQQNLRLIQEHNERYRDGEVSYSLAENKFADMTSEEFVKHMNGLNITRTYSESISRPDVSDLPSTVDWRPKGYVTPVKDQGQCGSCWAFSTTGSLEGQHFNATGKLVSLSESNLVDCSGPEGNLGCRGGLMDQAFQYIIDNKGIDTEASYPYVPKTGGCHFDRDHVGATVKGYVDIPRGSEEDLQKAVAAVGPISVAIDASHYSFQFYKSGVYNEPRCSSRRLDHGVLVVGYGTEDDTDYWLVKNSWSPSWGDEGYIKMSRNLRNQCGIATAASYPVV